MLFRTCFIILLFRVCCFRAYIYSVVFFFLCFISHQFFVNSNVLVYIFSLLFNLSAISCKLLCISTLCCSLENFGFISYLSSFHLLRCSISLHKSLYSVITVFHLFMFPYISTLFYPKKVILYLLFISFFLLLSFFPIYNVLHSYFTKTEDEPNQIRT